MGLHDGPRNCVVCKLSDEVLPSSTPDAGTRGAVALEKPNWALWKDNFAFSCIHGNCSDGSALDEICQSQSLPRRHPCKGPRVTGFIVKLCVAQHGQWPANHLQRPQVCMRDLLQRGFRLSG